MASRRGPGLKRKMRSCCTTSRRTDMAAGGPCPGWPVQYTNPLIPFSCIPVPAIIYIYIYMIAVNQMIDHRFIELASDAIEQ
jgi:hypothetical protein